MAATGNTATLVLGTSGFTACYREIDPGERSIGDLEDSCLNSADQKEYVPEDLEEPGEMRLVLFFDPNADLPPLGSPETATVTYPLKSGGSTQATEAGTGYFKRIKSPTLVNGQLMMAEATWKWDGKTSRTFTKGT